MNVILAAIGFMVLFSYGFHVPPAWVGNIVSNSPAQKAGLPVGAHIILFDGKPQEDFTKITLNTALVEESAPIPMVVDKPDTLAANTTYHRVTLTVTPARRAQDTGFLAIGFEAPRLLQAVKLDPDEREDLKKVEGIMAKGVIGASTRRHDYRGQWPTGGSAGLCPFRPHHPNLVRQAGDVND